MKAKAADGTQLGRVIALASIVAVALLGALLIPADASASTSCTLVASPAGSDTAPGTADQPLKSVQRLLDKLAPGQTGCLRSGTYAEANQEIRFTTASTTLASYPGERATIKGRVYVTDAADGTTITDLNIDGRNDRTLPSPTINGDDVVIRGNDITNGHTSICISVGSPDTWGRAHRTLIEGNRIHDCGLLPATNYDHGIYVSAADDTVIRDNLIYDNADRGIQMYADAQRTIIEGNVIDGNGQGIIFGGSEQAASSGNVVEHNVITNSVIRDNVESSWGGEVGTGNVVRSNCIGGGAYDEGDGGILGGSVSKVGFNASGNLLEAPAFANADAGDFTIDPSSPCAAMVAGATKTEAVGTTPEAGTVTITASKRKVKRMKRVRVRGDAPGAGSVTLMALRNGEWRPLQQVRADASGEYGARVLLRTSGRTALKAVAGGLRDSQPVKVRVKA